MKKSNLITKTIIAATTTLLMACGGSGSKSSGGKPTLNGTWEIVKAEGMMAETNVGTKYIFSDTELTFSKDGFDNKANSAHTDSTFTWNNGTMIMDYKYKFVGEQLIVKPVNSDQTLYLDKK